MCNALSQLVLRMTVPGIPDTYQGTEFWDDSLVDPDNRREVDYRWRTESLASLNSSAAGGQGENLVRKLCETRRDGRIKQYILWRLLNLRRQNPELFLDGNYRPLEAEGKMQEHVIAFTRAYGNRCLITAVTRLAFSLGSEFPPKPQAWRGTNVQAGSGTSQTWRDVLTGRVVKGSVFSCADLFSLLPVAVLLEEG
jgi:(1->4)-alpha-D-glucan 1-alpha-D-glucosylmutase